MSFYLQDGLDVAAAEVGYVALGEDAKAESRATWTDAGNALLIGIGYVVIAMAVFDVADDQVQPVGRALASEPALTLIYQRERAAGWPYNLYCMMHGRDRALVTDGLAGVMARTGLHAVPHAVLFSRQRFKQQGARRFATAERAPSLVYADA